MRHRQQRVARRLRLLQQLHRGVTTYQSNVVECHPCAEGDFRPIRRSRHVGDRQWHPVCIGRVRRICENVEFRPRYIFTEIPAVKRQGRERGQDSEATLHQVSPIWSVRVPSAVRLAQHPDGRNADKPSTTTDGPPVQDAATDRRSTTSAPLEQDAQDVLGRKERQAFFYNKKTKPLEPIAPGETIRLRLPGQQTWSAGTCLRTSGPRSYKVEVDGVVYRRNRRQLIRTSEPEPSAPATLEPEPESNLEKAPTVPVPVSQQAAEPTPQAEAMKLPVEAPRRSERVRKQPAWMKDYSTCN